MTHFNSIKICKIGRIVCLLLTVFLPSLSKSQDAGTQPPYRPTPAHMWEFGLHGGTAMSFGDIDFVPNFGAGFHVRKAIDYVFSIRGEALLATLKQKDNVNGTSETNIQSGSLQMVVSINNLIWNNVSHRKTNVYTFVGGGITRFEVSTVNIINNDLHAISPTVQTHLDGGLGVAFRLSNRFNLGIEAKALALFGKNADLLDGVARRNKDAVGYGSVRLNFNLGNSNTKSEPLYWVNPMDKIMQDITELKDRPTFDLTDSDGDGVIDLLDQDNTTPPGVVVDTRGLPLDSDGDGIPNFQDEEPYYPQDTKGVSANGAPQTQSGSRPIRNEDDVRKVVQDEFDKLAQNGGTSGRSNSGTPNNNGSNNPSRTSKDVGSTGNSSNPSRSPIYSGTAITDWFLPIVHFNIDDSKIRYSEYGNLASVAHVMKSNPDMTIVVTGFTDKTASDEYNLDLSYRRAKAAIEHLVNVHGIPRSRLLLNYNGEDYPLVPSTGSTIMNRRVEFRAATADDVEMENPIPISKKSNKKGGF
ncbi:MAG: OmpA family protein [Bacteroidetes bacterium]|nr:OmpA family protein [Bacteroidota bacterium]